jgi:tetratricopeptide (TPR) repeat protein
MISVMRTFSMLLLSALLFLSVATRAPAQPVTATEIRDAQQAVAAARDDLERSQALLRLGSIQLDFADLNGAKSSFENCTTLMRNRAKADGEESRQYLVKCLGMLGFVLWRQHDLQKVLVVRQEQVAAARQGMSANPHSDEWQDLLLDSLKDLTFAYLEIRNNAAASSTAAETVTAARAIVSQRPNSGEAEFDLHEALAKQGEAFYDLGDTASAEKSYNESLNILAGLSAANPNSVQINHDYIITLVRLGDITKKEAYFQKALETAQAMQRRGILPAEDVDMIEDIKSRLSNTQR